jgi:excisionase family DNA binding protein
MGQPIGSLEEALLDSHAPEETVAILRLAAEKGEFCAVTPNGEEIRFGGVVAGMLAEMVESLSTGQQAYLGSASAVLSPEDAAQVLGVSRPYVYRLMDRGMFPHVQQDAGSTRRKLLLTEVLDYQARRLRRIAAADDLAERSRREPVYEERPIAALARAAARSGDASELKAELARRRVSRVRSGVAASAAARDATDDGS